eukprot:3075726-Pyramimonas_sp.AAC.1
MPLPMLLRWERHQIAKSGSRFLSSGFRSTQTARSSKDNRYSLFGGATLFPNSVITLTHITRLPPHIAPILRIVFTYWRFRCLCLLAALRRATWPGQPPPPPSPPSRAPPASPSVTSPIPAASVRRRQGWPIRWVEKKYA